MKRLGAERALELFSAGVCEFVVLIVALLVETLSTVLANPWLIVLMDPHVSIERRRAIERFSAQLTNVRFLRRVNDFMSAKSRRLTEPFTAHFAYKWPNSGVNWHMTC